MVREIEGKFSNKAKHFNVMIEGIWPTPFEGESERPGFYTTYDVIAETEEEAVNQIKRFEPEEVKDSIKVEEIKIIENRPNDPTGVYETSGYGFFPRDDKN
jgi:hypothetical protein